MEQYCSSDINVFDVIVQHGRPGFIGFEQISYEELVLLYDFLFFIFSWFVQLFVLFYHWTKHIWSDT